MTLDELQKEIQLSTEEMCMKVYPCELCEYLASSKGHLAKHGKAVHEGILTVNVQKHQGEAHPGLVTTE